MTYNGWKNRDTWLVSMQINNDYGIYKAAVEFMESYKGRKPYLDFVQDAHLEDSIDGGFYTNSDLSIRELNSMMREMV
jgi:hypothetical protein